MGGMGHLPDAGGVQDQPAKMLEAFQIMADWSNRLSKTDG